MPNKSKCLNQQNSSLVKDTTTHTHTNTTTDTYIDKNEWKAIGLADKQTEAAEKTN